MLYAKDACKLVAERSKMPYVRLITETDTEFVIPTLTANGEALLEPAYVVNKITGEISLFRRSKENYERLKKGKQIEIPEQYRYPGEIKY